jgi:hypothetical protein
VSAAPASPKSSTLPLNGQARLSSIFWERLELLVMGLPSFASRAARHPTVHIAYVELRGSHAVQPSDMEAGHGEQEKGSVIHLDLYSHGKGEGISNLYRRCRREGRPTGTWLQGRRVLALAVHALRRETDLWQKLHLSSSRNVAIGIDWVSW